MLFWKYWEKEMVRARTLWQSEKCEVCDAHTFRTCSWVKEVRSTGHSFLRSKALEMHWGVKRNNSDYEARSVPPGRTDVRIPPSPPHHGRQSGRFRTGSLLVRSRRKGCRVGRRDPALVPFALVLNENRRKQERYGRKCRPPSDAVPGKAGGLRHPGIVSTSGLKKTCTERGLTEKRDDVRVPIQFPP